MTPFCFPSRRVCVCWKRGKGVDSYARLGPLMAMGLVTNVLHFASCFVAQRHFIQGIVIAGNKG